MNRKDADRHARAKRTAALARPELREVSSFISVDKQLPEEGRLCIAWAASDFGAAYRLPFQVRRRVHTTIAGNKFNEWHHARLGTTIQAVRIVGWIYVSSPQGLEK